jgi:tRNA pseudouridine38-40 synthase
MRIALGVEYDGGGLHGWQTQPGGGTVQDELESALGHIAGEKIAVVCAGRTDAGVHAAAQVAHFDTEARRPPTAWVRGVNGFLPPAIAVRWARPVSDAFHARFSAYGRCYRYLLINRAQRPGIWHGRAGWYHPPLDETSMREAARLLLGEHDFSAFRAADCQARTPVRTMRRAEIGRAGDMLVFDFEANAFLHHMIRNIVGSLAYVGQGKHPPGWIGELISSRDRTRAAPTFAADGLYLVGVRYEKRWQLPLAENPFPSGYTLP